MKSKLPDDYKLPVLVAKQVSGETVLYAAIQNRQIENIKEIVELITNSTLSDAMKIEISRQEQCG